MGLSLQDEQLLSHWFDEKSTHPSGSDMNYKYRDMIFTHVLENLSDYFSTLKHGWKQQFFLSEEDCVSIIHDGLLSAVTNFNAKYESHNKAIKFITYLTAILKNLATDYARRNHVRYVGKADQRRIRKMKRIPENWHMSLDVITSEADHDDPENEATVPQTTAERRFTTVLSKVLMGNEQSIETRLTDKVLVEKLLERLSEHDRRICTSILRGDSLNEIAAELGITTPGLEYRLRRIANKFREKSWE